jgi:hypothetical protein
MKDLGKVQLSMPEVLHARVRPATVDLMEVFSGFAEVSIQFAKKGHLVTQPIDLITGWDLFKNEHWDSLLDYVHQVKPRLIVMAPPCGPWSSLQNLNLRRPGYAKQLERLRRAHRVLLRRVAQLYMIQLESGRHALIENPWTSLAWRQPELKQLLEHADSYVARCDQCTTGLKAPSGAPLRKRTLFLGTNAHIAAKLSRTCSCSARGLAHEHIEGGSLAELAGRYTPHLARLILQGFKEHDRDFIAGKQLWPADAREPLIIEPEPELAEEEKRSRTADESGAGAGGAAASAEDRDRPNDFWRFDARAQTWTRHHIRPRHELCDPQHALSLGPDPAAGFPQPEKLTSERRTVFHPVGRHEIFTRRDDWRDERAVGARTTWEWTGHTVFYPILPARTPAAEGRRFFMGGLGQARIWRASL